MRTVTDLTNSLAVELSDTWENILWREQQHCRDEEYAERLGKLIPDWQDQIGWLDRRSLKQQGRPPAMEIEAALRRACAIRSKSDYDWGERLQRLDEEKRRTTSLGKLVVQLEAHHWFERFTARHVLVYYGGEVLQDLRGLAHLGSPVQQQVAQWMLQSIGAETTARLAQTAEQLLCPGCLVCCHRLEISLPGQASIDYYGCRACGQSRSFQPRPACIVAVLDIEMKDEQVGQEKLLRVNWFRRERLFDFDRVEIILADDEQVERFAVRVGNDTDPVRSPRYRQMLCLIGPVCHLSENSIHVLESTFGRVEAGSESHYAR
jgi:hypothetical protein